MLHSFESKEDVKYLCAFPRILLNLQSPMIKLPEAEFQCDRFDQLQRSSSSVPTTPTIRVISTSCLFIALDDLLDLFSALLPETAMRKLRMPTEKHLIARNHAL